MTSITPGPAAPDTSNAAGSGSATSLFQGIAIVAAAVATLPAWAHRLQGVRQAWPAIEHFGSRFVWTNVWNPVTDQYGALTFIYGTVRHVADRTCSSRRRSRSRSRCSSPRSRRSGSPRRSRRSSSCSRRSRRSCSVCGAFSSSGPGSPTTSSRGSRSWFGFLPIFSGDPVAGGHPARRADPDDHDRPDRVGDLPRALPAHAARPDGRCAGARLDALGGDPRRHVRLRRSRDRRRRAPRARSRLRRGDRGDPGDRQPLRSSRRSWFEAGDTLGSRIASQYQGAPTDLAVSSLLYLGAILMVISLATNIAAQFIVRRFEKQRRAA